MLLQQGVPTYLLKCREEGLSGSPLDAVKSMATTSEICSPPAMN